MRGRPTNPNEVLRSAGKMAAQNMVVDAVRRAGSKRGAAALLGMSERSLHRFIAERDLHQVVDDALRSVGARHRRGRARAES